MKPAAALGELARRVSFGDEVTGREVTAALIGVGDLLDVLRDNLVELRDVLTADLAGVRVELSDVRAQLDALKPAGKPPTPKTKTGD